MPQAGHLGAEFVPEMARFLPVPDHLAVFGPEKTSNDPQQAGLASAVGSTHMPKGAQRGIQMDPA